MNWVNHLALRAVVLAVTYSTSIDDSVMIGCFSAVHFTTPVKSSMGKSDLDSNDLFPMALSQIMNFASDSHDLGWAWVSRWVVGVSKYSRIPNLVKYDYPLWRNWPSNGPARGLPKDCIAQICEIK